MYASLAGAFMGAMVTSVLFVARIYGGSNSLYVMAFSIVMLLCTLAAFVVTYSKNFYRPKLSHTSGYDKKVIGFLRQDLVQQEDVPYITAHGVLIGATVTGLVLTFLMHGNPRAPHALLACVGLTFLCTIVAFGIKRCSDACRSASSGDHSSIGTNPKSAAVVLPPKMDDCGLISQYDGVISSSERSILEKNVGQDTLVKSPSDGTSGGLHVQAHRKRKVLVVSAPTTALDEMSRKYMPGGELHAHISQMLEEGGAIRPGNILLAIQPK
ncbi:MAG: hypothetical protein ACTJLK_03080 [Anaplasma sp.]